MTALLFRRGARELSGKVLGLVGDGVVGRTIASRAAHYGMEVISTDAEPGAGPYRRVLLGELLATSDFVLPLESATANTLRDERFLVLMKPGAHLVSLADVAEEPRQPQHELG